MDVVSSCKFAAFGHPTTYQMLLCLLWSFRICAKPELLHLLPLQCRHGTSQLLSFFLSSLLSFFCLLWLLNLYHVGRPFLWCLGGILCLATLQFVPQWPPSLAACCALTLQCRHTTPNPEKQGSRNPETQKSSPCIATVIL